MIDRLLQKVRIVLLGFSVDLTQADVDRFLDELSDDSEVVRITRVEFLRGDLVGWYEAPVSLRKVDQIRPLGDDEALLPAERPRIFYGR